jgi:two-component system sensor histidine kinase/response regulator
MTPHFWSLRKKFVLFLSLIIAATCSGLSIYFILSQRTAMKEQLMGLGKLLVNNIVHNGRYGLITEDPVLLERLVEAALDVDEVVYVIITGSDGRRLAARTKGTLIEGVELARDAAKQLYPPPESMEKASREQAGSLQVTLLPASGRETLYDFVMPVAKNSAKEERAGPFFFEPTERSAPGRVLDQPQPLGVIQLGLTDAFRQRHLHEVIQTIVLMTLGIVVLGILATIALAGRIITPLKSLSLVARQVAEGDLTASVRRTTRDEVGQLTDIFNQMTQSLRDRDQAITRQLSIIRKQVGQLTSLNQTASAITSTLDIDKLLDLVMQRCVEHVGFSRMVLAFYDADRRVAFDLHVVGVTQEIERASRAIEIPVHDKEGLDAELLLRGRPVLVHDLEEAADRLYPPLLALCRKVGVMSFVAVPLKSKDRMLGFLAGDFADRRCTQEDLDLLMTIASHIAVAIDNARTYHELEHLTQTLEQRVEERTTELQTANERLVELDKLRAAFVSIVSHELRTPMTSIKGYVENMLDGLTGALSERQEYYLTRVKYNVERLTRMLNQLLDIGRIEEGRVELHLAPLTMPDLIQEVAEGLQSLAQKKSILLTTAIENDIPAIQADRDKLNQVLVNLIGNAIKFTPNGGTVQVRVTVIPSEEIIQVCIADTGCGIAPHELEKVFEKFYRGEAAPQEAVGAGLGLQITKHLVELHTGRIWVTSILGVGSQFYFTVPVAGPPPKN